MGIARARPTPLAALRRGVIAGVAGTAAMTAAQELAARVRSSGDGDGGDQDTGDAWNQASAPAKVARRIIEGVFHRDAPADWIPALTHGMHWAYGTAWGAVLGLIEASADRPRPLGHGLPFGAAVWAMSYAQLVPMGLYDPPWKYPAPELALDLSYHLVWGAGAGTAYAVAAR